MNNNPGKLIKGPIPFIGEKLSSSDSEYCQFYEVEFGYRAMFVLIKMFIQLGYNTVLKLLIRWAPRPKAEIDKYLAFVITNTGFTEDTLINPDDKSQMIKLISAISHFESMEIPKEHHILKAWDLFSTTKYQ